MESKIEIRVSQDIKEHDQIITKIFSIAREGQVKDLKSMIREGFGVPEDHQQLRLLRDGRKILIESDKSLQEYGLRDGDGFELEIKIPTAKPEETKSPLSGSGMKKEKSNNNGKGQSNSSDSSEDEGERNSERRATLRELIPRDALLLTNEIISNAPTSVKKLIDEIARSEADAAEIRVKLVIDANAEGGWNSLHHAIGLGLTGVVRELLERNADVNKPTNDGWTPLQIAVDKNQELICKMILEQPELNINAITSRSTALHIAATNGNKKLAQILLFHDADLTIKDRNGRFPYEVATDKQIADMLLISSKEMSSPKPRNLKEEAMPPKPIAVKGWLWKLGPFMNHKKRYFVLDPNQFTFSHYMNENEYPRKPRKVVHLLQIKEAKKINGGWLTKKQYFYFELHYEGKARMFACKTEEAQTQWVEYLKQAYLYASYVENKIRQHLHFIQDFDDNATSPKKLHSTYFMKVDHSIELLDQTESEKKAAQQKQEEDRILMSPCEKTSPFYTVGFDYPEGTDACLEHFDAVSKIGNGAFGTVYKVKRRSDGKIFAIKTLKKRALMMRNQMNSAISEKNILVRAQSPYVIHIENAFQTRDHLYLCLEYCSGGDLASIIDERDKITEDEARLAAAEMVVMVDYLHSINVLYRDMKPDNMLIDEEGHLKIIDFGLSRLDIKNGTVCKSFCGSPAYLAPEMLKRQGATWATDVYGIGTVLYELLTGEPPFYSHDITTIYENMKKGKLAYPKSISPNAKDLLMKLLDPLPFNRIGVADKREIMKHPFFAGIDWEKTAKKQGPPPFPKK